MDRGLALILTLAAGAFVTLQPPANAALAHHVGDLGAALVSLSLATVIAAILLLVFGDPGRLAGISAFHPEYALGGLGGAAVVIVSLVTVRTLGAGGVTAVLVSGQLIVSVLLDRYGLLGLQRVALDWQRGLGVALIIAGAVLVTSR
ncbi:MAG TPA: DMT family transporter [Solirubrobacteraceae bacterium]|jgi:transporter family-2 protein|nr:DMT family transporter [Solirubrobacteraceae bacterium]